MEIASLTYGACLYALLLQVHQAVDLIEADARGHTARLPDSRPCGTDSSRLPCTRARVHHPGTETKRRWKPGSARMTDIRR
jgi:hypothetical protein